MRRSTSTAYDLVALLGVWIVWNTGCVSRTMTQVQPEYSPQGHRSLVTFYRPHGKNDAEPFRLWSGKEVIGLIKGGTLVQYHTEPGMHTFLCEAGNWSVVQADLSPGAHYAMVIDESTDGRARVKLTPVGHSSKLSRKDVYMWLSTHRIYRLNPEERASRNKGDIRAAERAMENVRAGRLPKEELSADDNL